MTKKPDQRDAPFKRTVTRADVETSKDLETLKRGRQEASNKAGYWRGKQLEPDAPEAVIAYGAEREQSASATEATAERRTASLKGSQSRTGARGFWSLKADEFHRQFPEGNDTQLWHWLLKLDGAQKRTDLDTGEVRIEIPAKGSIKASSLRDTLSHARARAAAGKSHK